MIPTTNARRVMAQRFGGLFDDTVPDLPDLPEGNDAASEAERQVMRQVDEDARSLQLMAGLIGLAILAILVLFGGLVLRWW